MRNSNLTKTTLGIQSLHLEAYKMHYKKTTRWLHIVHYIEVIRVRNPSQTHKL